MLENRTKAGEYPGIIQYLSIGSWAGVTRICELNTDLKIVKLSHTWIAPSLKEPDFLKPANSYCLTFY